MPWACRGGKDDSNIALFLTTRLAAFTHLLLNVMRSKIFFYTSDAKNTKPDHNEKSLHRHTIPSFALSKSPFGLQLGFDASHQLPDVIPKRANSLVVVEGVLSRFFQPTATASAIRHVGQARLVLKPRRGNAFRASHQESENSELFKELNPGTQFQRERISSAVQLCRSLRGSEAEPTTSSRYSSFRGRERSLDPRRL